MISIETMIGIIRVAKQDKPFYAKDLGLKSYTMSALSSMGVIKKTGNSRQEFINLYDDIYKEVEVFEWKPNISEWALDSLRREMNNARQVIKEFDEAGL